MLGWWAGCRENGRCRMTFSLTIECDNAAFDDAGSPSVETARILDLVACRAREGPLLRLQRQHGGPMGVGGRRCSMTDEQDFFAPAPVQPTLKAHRSESAWVRQMVC